MQQLPVERLRNIGTTLSKRLASIDVRTRKDLEKVGPVRAYRLLCSNAGRKLPICYNLYSLEGALKDKDWRELSEAEKTSLKQAANSLD